MKIITVNIPVQYINKIKGLIGNEGLYPSRSELIRVAVRDYLIKELKMAKITAIGKTDQPIITEQDLGFVQVPTDVKVGDTTIRDFKTYRIIDRANKVKHFQEQKRSLIQ